MTRLKAAEHARLALATRLQQLGQGPVSPRVDWRETARQGRRMMQE